MEIITPNYEEMSKTSAKIIASEIRRKHDLVLGWRQVTHQWGCIRNL